MINRAARRKRTIRASTSFFFFSNETKVGSQPLSLQCGIRSCLDLEVAPVVVRLSN
jgi:hypothetical protein